MKRVVKYDVYCCSCLSLSVPGPRTVPARRAKKLCARSWSQCLKRFFSYADFFGNYWDDGTLVTPTATSQQPPQIHNFSYFSYKSSKSSKSNKSSTSFKSSTSYKSSTLYKSSTSSKSYKSSKSSKSSKSCKSSKLSKSSKSYKSYTSPLPGGLQLQRVPDVAGN